MSKGRKSQSRRAQRSLERELFGPEPRDLPAPTWQERWRGRLPQGDSVVSCRKDLDQGERVLVKCALGRLFRIMSRPYQDGDVEQFEQCRRVVLDVLQPPF